MTRQHEEINFSMNQKPTTSSPVIVYKVTHVYRGIFSVDWSDLLNYPRKLSALFRKIDGQWFSGTENTTGVYSSPLRAASSAIASAIARAESRPE